jgi:excisionase family DNA binding protein
MTDQQPTTSRPFNALTDDQSKPLNTTEQSALLPRRAWSPREVGHQLGLPYDSVLLAIQNGQIATFRIGRHHRVPDSELDRLLESASVRS